MARRTALKSMVPSPMRTNVPSFSKARSTLKSLMWSFTIWSLRAFTQSADGAYRSWGFARGGTGAISNAIADAAREAGVEIRTESKVTSLQALSHYDAIVITTGGGTASLSGLPLVEEVPSLFTFSVADEGLRALMGTVVESATAFLPGTGFRAQGPLLVTHWGMSGPAVLKLSSYAARHLHLHHYQAPLAVNWLSLPDADVLSQLQHIVATHPQKLVATIRPFDLPSRLWTYLVQKALGERAQNRWQNLSQKELNRLVNVLTCDAYQIAGRAAFKDEFVTCGGIDLSAVSPNTLESKTLPHVYFAGEVLDIDGITGGFNFQAAWTTAYTVAKAIVSSNTMLSVINLINPLIPK